MPHPKEPLHFVAAQQLKPASEVASLPPRPFIPPLPIGAKGEKSTLICLKDNSFSTEAGLSQQECELRSLINWVRSVVHTELSSMNQKLDRLTEDVRHSTEKTVISQGVPLNLPSRCSSPSRSCSFSRAHSGSPTQVCRSSPVSPASSTKAMRGTSSSMDPAKNFRTKVRFIGTLIAAAKRAKKQKNSAEVPHSDLSKNTDLSTLTRKHSNPSLGGIAHIMAPMWDVAAEARMDKIQKFLYADRSKQTLRMKFWNMTERPFSSKVAYAYLWIINTLVFSSVVFHLVLMHAEDFCEYGGLGLEVPFAIEFVLRVICCPNLCSFMRSWYNWIDMLAVIPLGLRLSSFKHNQTVLALIPMLRSFKLLRRFEKLRLLSAAFKMSLEALPLLLYTLALIAIVFSEIFFFVEPRSNIKDLPDALWFTMVTMTTVGYGDVTPATGEGHIAASVLMVISALYMAMPLGIVGDAFSRVWADRDRLLVIKRFRGAFFERGFSLQSFQDVFNIFDEDGSGALDVNEFTEMLRTMQMSMTEERINVLFATIDKEGKGEITLQRLIALLAPKALPPQIFDQRRRLPTLSLNPLSFISSSACKSTSAVDDSLSMSGKMYV